MVKTMINNVNVKLFFVDVADIGDAVGHNNILTYNGGTINGINYEKIPE